MGFCAFVLLWKCRIRSSGGRLPIRIRGSGVLLAGLGGNNRIWGNFPGLFYPVGCSYFFAGRFISPAWIYARAVSSIRRTCTSKSVYVYYTNVREREQYVIDIFPTTVLKRSGSLIAGVFGVVRSVIVRVIHGITGCGMFNAQTMDEKDTKADCPERGVNHVVAGDGQEG